MKHENPGESHAPPIRRRYVDIAAGQVHLRECGRGRTLVLLHPSPCSSAMWEPVMPLLAAGGLRAVAIDLPGFGGSSRPAIKPSIPAYADSVFAALDELAIDRCDVFGSHTGATVALWMARQFPGRVRRLVLWGVQSSPPPAPDAGTAPPRGLDADGERLAAYWRRGFVVGERARTPDFAYRRMIDFLQTGPRGAGHGPAEEVDYDALLGAITQPVLVMAGERDELWDDSRIAQERIPGARFEAIPGGSVYVADEYPEALAARILGFLGSAGEP